ncbi:MULTISPECIES: DASH family cryptochrome [Psychrobacter]|uniref:DASH family cryptochrome n=2 Tax=Gammaproteobacteria TaxID=1236 RepID=UPI000C327CA7|nr:MULTISPECIES: DASH family cryptochrome [Psychrobacter]PKG34123.1 deoxyribodipyrimidine photolyase [Psychrobacter sp. Sarcosine-3u-12]
MSNQLVANESGEKTVLMLFHNDLRVHDNATLSHAAALADSGSLIMVYASELTDSQTPNWGQAYHFDERGLARQQFLMESLADLKSSIQRLGNRLLHLNQDKKADEDAFTQLCQLIESQNVNDICVSNTADYAQNLAYKALRNKYPQIIWHYQSTATLFGTMPTQELPKSFTQFRKKVEYEHNLLSAQDALAICQTPTKLPSMPKTLDSSHYTFETKTFDKSVQLEPNFKGGEGQALVHLNNYFESDAPSSYKTTRNAFDTWTDSTKFSPWLANGSLSVKVLLNRLRQYEQEVIANDSTYWIWFELLWREYFYWYGVTHDKELFLFKGISHQAPANRHNQQRLEAWQNGETRYPIINACMKQLNSTGYMSNRGRQLVASAFIHELGLDWRYGATYFEQQLIDYDVCSNWGNWQYLAGVSADPRGCRQFNLKKQMQQHDPAGVFMDKWLS